MTPRILIVDDEEPARARLKTLLLDIAAQCPHVLAGEAENAEKAMVCMAQLQPDIVLLDVQMPGMTGVELAKKMIRDTSSPTVIFVTAFEEYAVRAFEVKAIDYLLKPVRAARLAEAIGRAVEKRSTLLPLPAQEEEESDARRHFSVHERGRLRLIPATDVRYLKADAKYVTLRTQHREYVIEASLSALEQAFSAHFIRVHRNALVARDAIIGVERSVQIVDADGDERTQESWQVVLRDIEERLPISRRQWSQVRALVR